jgi:3-hydroxybutyrate dehydrogenase
MAALETPEAGLKHKIRVNCVAPAIIKTPLWTAHADKSNLISEDSEVWVAPEDVAATMLDLVQREDYVGGTIVEVGVKGARIVPCFDDPGPIASGAVPAVATNIPLQEKEIFESLRGGWQPLHK